MNRVYVLAKHPPYPYDARLHLRAGEIVGVFSSREEPQKIANAKNARRSSYLWSVHRKVVKP